MPLIFDLGFCDGADTAWYLAKGFRVVAVEANPVLAEAGRKRFADEIAAQRLTLLNVGIAKTRGTLPFYVNESNEHWSSFDPSYGCRNDTAFHVVDVPTVTIADFVADHGLPYYMKIDIEGVDRIVLDQMRALSCRPQHISVEEFGAATFNALAALGYTRARVVPQNHRAKFRLPRFRREGAYVRRQFDSRCSGPFGRDLLIPWQTMDEAGRTYIAALAAERANPRGEWWDVHATAHCSIKIASSFDAWTDARLRGHDGGWNSNGTLS